MGDKPDPQKTRQLAGFLSLARRSGSVECVAVIILIQPGFDRFVASRGLPIDEQQHLMDVVAEDVLLEYAHPDQMFSELPPIPCLVAQLVVAKMNPVVSRNRLIELKVAHVMLLLDECLGDAGRDPPERFKGTQSIRMSIKPLILNGFFHSFILSCFVLPSSRRHA